MGFSSLDDFLIGFWEKRFLRRDANNLLDDAGRVAAKRRECDAGVCRRPACRARPPYVRKRSSWPRETDLYFTPDDLEYEASLIPGARFEVIRSVWGHQAGNGLNPADSLFIDRQLKWLLEQ